MSEQHDGNNLRVNALYTIFEKHLYDFEDTEESEVAFIDKIVQDYLRFIVTQGVAIPRRWHAQITDELRDQVRKMMIKKMYGALSIEEFVTNQTDRKSKQRTSQKKYSKLF